MKPITRSSVIGGHHSKDYLFHRAVITLEDTDYVVTLPSGVFRCRALRSERPLAGKGDAELSDALLEQADAVKFGGGDYNSAAGLRSIAPGLPVLCVDSACEDPELRRDLAAQSIDYLSLNLAEPAISAVFPSPASPGDKLILRGRPPVMNLPPAGLGATLAGQLRGRPLLANSCKHRWLMTGFAGAAARGGATLHVMLTPWLPPEYVLGAILPYAEAVTGGLDEIGRILGVATPETLTGAAAALRTMFEHAGRGSVYVTMGPHGVMVADIDTRDLYHVRLRTAAAAKVQAFAEKNPLLSVGAGDRFAAGVFGSAVAGCNVARGTAADYPASVVGAMAGTAAALRQLGGEDELTVDDFAVRSLGCAEAAGREPAA
jgi:hypothetical protein